VTDTNVASFTNERVKLQLTRKISDITIWITVIIGRNGRATINKKDIVSHNWPRYFFMKKLSAEHLLISFIIFISRRMKKFVML
jgi:hypothetical protein